MTSFQFAFFMPVVLGLLTILALTALHLLKRLLLLLIDVVGARLPPARDFRLPDHSAAPNPDAARPVQSRRTVKWERL